ncbi:serine/threonine-protein kinase [Georgenia sp. M64]|uniref:serine/threonine-protein kinase n=1 Tax=Georgenia sp. M64 TaxID=3120520 RepID=UPI0030E1E0E3
MSPRQPAPAPALPGYTFERPLGSGGFADVYLYTQHMPRRQVAVKVLTADATASREQFDAEANVMAQLSSHSSIVAIFHAGVAADGRPYLVMQYCPLPNLAERIRTRPLSVAEALGIGIRLAGAVETAHRAGIVHRDIKPANILTTEYGRPALTDFGIAGLVGAAAEDTAGVSIPWAPPESVEGRPAPGVSGDVYSLAATVHTLLAGRSPFTRPGGPNTRLDYTRRIRRDPVPPTGREDVPASLERALARGMAKQPAQRYASALDLGRALQVVEQELRLPVTDIEVPDTSWMQAARGGGDGEGRTEVRRVIEVDPTLARARVVTEERPPGPRETGRAGDGDAADVAPADDDAGTVLRGATVVRDESDDVTRARPRPLAAPDAAPDAAPAERPARRGRLVLAGVAVLLVAGGVVAAGALRGEEPPEPTEVTGTGLAMPERVASPVSLAGSREGTTVTFTWSPPEGAGEVTYTWQRTDPGADPQVRPAAEPVAVVEGAEATVCVAVKVRLPNGTTSAQPAEACVP